MKIFLLLLALFCVREVLAILLGWGRGESRTVSQFVEDVKHNRAIESKWRKDGRPVLSTTIGWKPDDSYRLTDVDDWGIPTYSKIERGGTQAYRERLEKESQ